MKKIIIIGLLFVISFQAWCQTQRFVYLVTYKPDKSVDEEIGQLFALDYSKGKSVFYSIENPESRQKYASQLLSSNPNVGWDLSWNIFKEKHKVDFLVYNSSDSYEYEEKEKTQWEIKEDFIDYGENNKVQLAETEFGGRTWQAYFDKNISIFDGPYKFRGLPGLIVKLQSVDGDYSFEMIAVDQVAEVLQEKPVNSIKLSKEKYLKLMLEKAKTPVADHKAFYRSRGYNDNAKVIVNDVPMTLGQMFKEREIVVKAWQEKHNNPVEVGDVWLQFERAYVSD